MESTRKLNNFNFQWTKTLYQNNLKNIAFFFTFFKGLRCNKSSVVTPEKIYYGGSRKVTGLLLFWYKICPLKMKITQCPGGFHLKFNATLHTCMVSRPGFEPGPHRREASAPITVPPLLPIYTTETRLLQLKSHGA